MIDTSLQQSLEIWQHNQQLFVKLLDRFDNNQLNRIPAGFNNNIVWNIGHCLATRMLLTYAIAKQPIPLDGYWIDNFRKGTKPTEDVSATKVEELKNLFTESLLQLKKDLDETDFFKQYSSYTTSTNFTIDSIEKAVAFAGFHDGIHIGSVLALAKLI